MKSKTYNCALYVRLSREDGDNIESESIKNQRDLIHMFLERTEEKLVYIGKTDSKSSRFSNGHLVALKLHNPRYQKYYKRVYFGTIMFLNKN